MSNLTQYDCNWHFSWGASLHHPRPFLRRSLSCLQRPHPSWTSFVASSSNRHCAMDLADRASDEILYLSGEKCRDESPPQPDVATFPGWFRPPPAVWMLESRRTDPAGYPVVPNLFGQDDNWKISLDLPTGAVNLMLARRLQAGVYPSLAPPQRTHVASLQDPDLDPSWCLPGQDSGCKKGQEQQQQASHTWFHPDPGEE